MYQVMQWMKETALAKRGFDLSQIEALSRASALPTWAVEKLGEADRAAKFVAQFNAMNDLQQNWRRMDGGEFMETMTTAMFTSYFADAISRAFVKDYQYLQGSWRDYTHADTTPDFRDVDRFRMTELGTLHKRREKAEAKADYITDTEVHYGVEEYSDQFDVSWRAIMNDDLGKIRETPQKMIGAVNRFEDSWVSALYDNATTQAALVALGALYAGTGRFTIPNIAIGLNAMKQRVDARGNRISIRKVWAVIPSILEIQAAVLLQSVLQPGVATNDKNVINQFLAGVKVDPYIATAGANVPWYLVADPNEIPAIPVARLQDWNGPVVVQKRSNIEVVSGRAPAAFLMGSFETGDIEYMVSDVIGGWDSATFVGVTDPNGIYYSSGTTP